MHHFKPTLRTKYNILIFRVVIIYEIRIRSGENLLVLLQTKLLT